VEESLFLSMQCFKSALDVYENFGIDKQSSAGGEKPKKTGADLQKETDELACQKTPIKDLKARYANSLNVIGNLYIGMLYLVCLDVVHFSKKSNSKNSKKSNQFFFKFRKKSKKIEKNRKKSKKILVHDLYFLTIVFASKRPLLPYKMTINARIFQ
jgi:hypothetical protein